MSPNEFDLRSALHDGEGEVLDVEQVLAGARRRSQRRVRVLTAAAAVVVVAGVATGVAVVTRGSEPATDSTGNRAGPGVFRVPSSASGAASSTVGPSVATAALCPSSFPQTLLPGGGSPGQFGASGRLFAQPVAGLVVCSYRTGRAAGRTVFDGSSARTLAASLENAARRPTGTACPDVVSADSTSLAIIGVTPSGRALRTVTTTLSFPSCNVRVTNGTAIRYDWTPPAALRKSLTQTPTVTPSEPVGSGSASTTPVHILPVLTPLHSASATGSATGSPIRRPIQGSPVH